MGVRIRKDPIKGANRPLADARSRTRRPQRSVGRGLESYRSPLPSPLQFAETRNTLSAFLYVRRYGKDDKNGIGLMFLGADV